MLVIRLQRVGRSGHAQYRVVVQDSRFSPTSGRVVAYVGNYNPHTKTAQLDAEAIKAHIKNGAQPSPRVASLMAKAKIELPAWVKPAGEKKRTVRNPEKRRGTRPEAPAEPVETPAETTAEEELETPAKAEASEVPAEKPTEATASEESIPEAPAEEAAEAPTEAPAEENSEPETPTADEPKTDEPADS